MFTITKKADGKSLRAAAQGPLDESANFDQELGELPRELILQMKLIPRVNSAGMRSWLRYFSMNRETETSVRLTEISPALMDAFHCVPDALAGIRIESVIVPFFCKECKAEWGCTFTTKELRESKFQIAPIRCPKCSKEATFDDDPASYFSCLIQDEPSR